VPSSSVFLLPPSHLPHKLTSTLLPIRTWLQRHGLLETAVLAGLLIVAGSLWLFLEIASVVSEGDSQQFDESVLRMLRAADGIQPIGPRWLVPVAHDLTALGSPSVIALLSVGVVGFLALRRKWGALCLVAASISGGALLNNVLKHSFDRTRPDASLRLAEVDSFSFPSGHTMLAAITYFTLGALLARTTGDRRVKCYFLAIAALLVFIVGVTRIFLGVHFPTDVLAGWCSGIAWALLCSLIARWLQRKGAVEPASPPREP
jgi:undecaprenyl-diphosphatase